MVDRRGSIAEHDRAHLKGSETEKLARQRREAEEVEQRARQQLNAKRSEDWQVWFKRSLYAELTRPGDNPLLDGMGEAIATERAARQKELKAAVEEQQRAYDEKLAALEQRQHQVEQEQTANNQAAWEKFYGEVLATERAARQKEVKAAIEGAQRAVDAKLEALEQRIVQHIERHTDHCNHGIVVSAGRAETLGKMIETERMPERLPKPRLPPASAPMCSSAALTTQSRCSHCQCRAKSGSTLRLALAHWNCF